MHAGPIVAASHRDGNLCHVKAKAERQHPDIRVCHVRGEGGREPFESGPVEGLEPARDVFEGNARQRPHRKRQCGVSDLAEESAGTGRTVPAADHEIRIVECIEKERQGLGRMLPVCIQLKQSGGPVPEGEAVPGPQCARVARAFLGDDDGAVSARHPGRVVGAVAVDHDDGDTGEGGHDGVEERPDPGCLVSCGYEHDHSHGGPLSGVDAHGFPAHPTGIPRRTMHAILTSAHGDAQRRVPLDRVSIPGSGLLPRLRVDASRPRQEIHGVGSSLTQASAVALSTLTPGTRSRVLEMAFGPAGGRFSLVRTHIASCDFSTHSYTYALTPDPDLSDFSLDEDRSNGHLALLRDARAVAGAGFRLIASPWTAPPWMKDNGRYHDREARRGGRDRKSTL